MNAALGIDLQHLTAPVSIGSGDGISNDWKVASDVAIGTCVLPATRQQRPRIGVDAVAQSWNNGLPGRAESRFGGNCARLPAAAIWQLLRTNRVLPVWTYTDATGAVRTVGARDLLRATLPRNDARAAAAIDVLAVPNALNEFAREHVLAAWPSAPGTEKRLLWGPVAAAMAWADSLPAATRAGFGGRRMLVVDVEPWAISATLLELHSETVDGHCYLVPERYVPDAAHYLEQPLPPIDLLCAEAAARDAGAKLEPDTLWHAFVGSPLASRICSGANDAEAALLPGDDGWRTVELSESTAQRLRTQAVTATDLNAWRAIAAALQQASSSNVGTPSAVSFLDGIMNFLQLESFDGRDQVDHILLTGACLEMMLEGGSLAALVAAKYATREKPLPLTVAGLDDCPADLTRSGCVLFGLRAQHGLPTYYDHLQQLEILVQRQEDIVSEVLVQGGRIRGSEEFRRSPIEGFYLDRNFEYVEFYLHQEGSEHLKSLHQDFQVRIDKRQAISLQPSVRPGQGHVRVEVHNEELFGRQPVLLDWQKMADSERTVHDLAEEINRSYPPYIPDVKASKERWEFFTPHVEAYLDYPLLADGLEQDLGKILTRPFFWSVARVTFDETDATGLGRYNVFGAGDEAALPTEEPLVQRFLDRLVADFAAAKRPDNLLKLMRCIAWTYQGEFFSDVRRYLCDKLETNPDELKLQELTGCAQLFRQPAEFATFFGALLEMFECRGIEKMTDWLRNLRKLMTYRLDLFEHVDSRICMRTIVWVGRMLEAENLKQNFQNTSLLGILSILFLLRRRRYDPAFLRFHVDEWEAYRPAAAAKRVLLPLDEGGTEVWARREALVYDLALLVSRTETLIEQKIDSAGDEERREPYRLRLTMVREISKFIQGRGRFGGIPLKELG